MYWRVCCVGVGDPECYGWFVGCRAATDVDDEPRVRELDVPRRAAAVASAQYATSEDRFVKASRSFDVGDGQEVCDGKPRRSMPDESDRRVKDGLTTGSRK